MFVQAQREYLHQGLNSLSWVEGNCGCDLLKVKAKNQLKTIKMPFKSPVLVEATMSLGSMRLVTSKRIVLRTLA